MIQRIQSIYLLLAIILLVLISCGISIFTYSSVETVHTLNVFGIKSTESISGGLIVKKSIPLFTGSLILIVLAFFTILLFKNLKRQMMFARLTAFLYFIYLIAISFCYFLGSAFTDDKQLGSTFVNFGFYALLIGFVLVLLAINGIKKDQRLLASVDRIR